MLSSPVYLSPPSVHLPEDHETTDAIIASVRDRFRGDPAQWPAIESGLRMVFERCGTTGRYISRDRTLRVAEFAAVPARACLERYGVAPGEVDLVIFGSVAREYYEPATAMEVAACLGIERVQAFDVASACVGMLQGVQVAAGMFEVYPHYRTALVVCGEITRDHLPEEVDDPAELAHKAAGFTIGEAAAAWLVTREPVAGGCARLVAMGHLSLPQNWSLCTTPTEGTFTSYTKELFKLNAQVGPAIRELLERAGWTIDEVDRFVLHQPGDMMNAAILRQLGVPPEKHLPTHHLYGNTITTSVALNLHELLERGAIAPGHKLLIGGAAAGFSLSAMLAVWEA